MKTKKLITAATITKKQKLAGFMGYSCTLYWLFINKVKIIISKLVEVKFLHVQMQKAEENRDIVR